MRRWRLSNGVIEENGTILKQIEQASKQEGSNDISHQRAALPVSSSSCDLFGLCFHSYLPENCPIDKKNEGSSVARAASTRWWAVNYGSFSSSIIGVKVYVQDSTNGKTLARTGAAARFAYAAAAAIHFRNGAMRRQTPIAQLVRYGDCSRQQ